MNAEQIEAELTKLNGQTVILIRPYSANVSDSYCGILGVAHTEHETRFYLTMNEHSIMFNAESVLLIEDTAGTEHVKKIIRIRGTPWYENVT